MFSHLLLASKLQPLLYYLSTRMCVYVNILLRAFLVNLAISHNWPHVFAGLFNQAQDFFTTF